MATLLFTYLIADDKAVINSKFVTKSYIEVRPTGAFGSLAWSADTRT